MYSMFRLTFLFPATFNYLANKHHQLEIHFTAGICFQKYAPWQLEPSLRKNPYLKIFRISTAVADISVSDILLRAISLRCVVTRLLKLSEKYRGWLPDDEEYQHLASICIPGLSRHHGGQRERRGGGGGGDLKVGGSNGWWCWRPREARFVRRKWQGRGVSSTVSLLIWDPGN